LNQSQSETDEATSSAEVLFERFNLAYYFWQSLVVSEVTQGIYGSEVLCFDSMCTYYSKIMLSLI